MGGAGRALMDGFNFSSVNPALLAGFRRASLSALYRVQRRSLDEGTGRRYTVADGDLGAFQLAFPARGGFVLGVGLEPLTDMDFGVEDSVGTGLESHVLQLEATGGIQALSIGVAKRVSRELSLGVRLDWISMGTLTENWIKTYEDPRLTKSEDQIVRSHRGWLPSLGAVFTPSEHWAFGLAFQVETSVEQRQVLRNLNLGSEGEVRNEVDVTLPYVVGVGVAYLGGYYWAATVDFERGFWSRTEPGRHNTLDLSGGLLYRMGSPDPLSKSLRIEWNGGVHYRSLYFPTASGSQISELGVSLGVAIPFKNEGGRFRYLLEVGKRGDVQKHGVSERFIQQSISVSGFIN
ncbi:MAG: hypothetical protein O7G87_15520 [bacterium]|nr:hypothetical protein [bacterium]